MFVRNLDKKAYIYRLSWLLKDKFIICKLFWPYFNLRDIFTAGLIAKET